MEKSQFLDTLSDVGMPFIIREAFLGYKYRRNEKKLYDGSFEIPTKLISMYFALNPDKQSFDTLKATFIKHYIKNESELEDIDCSDIHGEIERKGLGIMYEYIHSNEVNKGGLPPFSFKHAEEFDLQSGRFNIWSLQDLHYKLFSLAPHSEEAGKFRNYDVYLPGTGTELSCWCDIEDKLWDLSDEVLRLTDISKKIVEKRNNGLVNEYRVELFEYITDVIKLNCKLVKIHPFSDGNGRTIRGFMNKLFEDVGLPPVYIKPNERTEYQEAMNLANNNASYNNIVGFYLYKICDSIIELDPRFELKNEKKKTI